MNTHQAHRVLQLDDAASMDEIKGAYRRLALESHPDRTAGGGDGSRFKEVTEAYNTLRRHHAAAAAAAGSAGGRPRGGPGGRGRSPGSPWGARPRPDGGPPEQDWGKFTREAEEGDPAWWREYERRFWEEYRKTVNADGRGGEFEKAQEPKRQPDLQVDVDPSLCIGCCSCEIIAPRVFRIDRESQTNPKSRVIDRRGAGVNKIMNAAETCPTKAINVRDAGTRERLYPR